MNSLRRRRLSTISWWQPKTEVLASPHHPRAEHIQHSSVLCHSVSDLHWPRENEPQQEGEIWGLTNLIASKIRTENYYRKPSRNWWDLNMSLNWGITTMNNPIFQTPHSSVILRIISIAGKGNKMGLSDVLCTSHIQIEMFQLMNFFFKKQQRKVQVK